MQSTWVYCNHRKRKQNLNNITNSLLTFLFGVLGTVSTDPPLFLLLLLHSFPRVLILCLSYGTYCNGFVIFQSVRFFLLFLLLWRTNIELAEILTPKATYVGRTHARSRIECGILLVLAIRISNSSFIKIEEATHHENTTFPLCPFLFLRSKMSSNHFWFWCGLRGHIQVGVHHEVSTGLCIAEVVRAVKCFHEEVVCSFS